MEFKKQKNGLSAPVKINHGELSKAFKAAGYTDPTLITGFSQFYYLCDRDPISTELDVLDPANGGVGVYVNIPDFIYMWLNQVTGEFFWCSDNTFNTMIWNHLVTNRNLADMINNVLGWEANTSRDYTHESTPAFSTVYTPSATNDTFVTVVVNLTSTLLTAAVVEGQIDAGGGYITRAKESLAGLVAGPNANTLTFIVPAGASYKIIETGNVSIVSVNYLSL